MHLGFNGKGQRTGLKKTSAKNKSCLSQSGYRGYVKKNKVDRNYKYLGIHIAFLMKTSITKCPHLIWLITIAISNLRIVT